MAEINERSTIRIYAMMTLIMAVVTFTYFIVGIQSQGVNATVKNAEQDSWINRHEEQDRQFKYELMQNIYEIKEMVISNASATKKK